MTGRRNRLARLGAQAHIKSGDHGGIYNADSERGVWVECRTAAERPMTPLEVVQVQQEEAGGRGVMFLGAGGYSKIIYGVTADDL
ncbi:hypothetical protein E7T06_20685 [Deinococcus sp. Arct2-2]|uniref:hypothetical protein n=1 Tax=Deinococcus sp. Arct2-2 TaxID=2568653 RepID=UPI0010A3B941|nr:hypothetical protein [Deinococcus sp. Arct2-2]THF66719.1 hypothetical protein E7T06_20685 [Deinococcus sp. Arct2-2]